MTKSTHRSFGAVISGCIAISGILACASVKVPAATPPSPSSNAVTRPRSDGSVEESQVRMVMSALADDSMEGRMTGSRGSAKAATFIARQMGEV
ncbi:MAG: hypothetical protein ABI035_06490, partial [Gemmatimonadaceae bacterium]